MKAAIFKGDGVMAVEEVTMPEIVWPDEVLVEVEAASICGSDLHILSVPPGQYGEPGTIMGHEFVAKVIEAGPWVKHVAVGDRVVIEPNIHCGVCPECRSGRENLCRNAVNIGQWRNGGFTQYCVVPQKQLHRIPKDIPAGEAALAEPLACVMNGMMRINPMPHEKVVIFGAGAVLEQAIEIMECGGRILVFGQNATQVSQIQPSEINCKELMIVGALSTLNSFPAAIELLHNPNLKLNKIISHEVALDEIDKGIALMRSREAVKVIVYPGGVR